MNNIDILEEMLKNTKTNKRGNKEIKFEVNSNYYTAILTLIAENKELKEENKCLKNKELDYMTVYLTGTYDERDKWKLKLEEEIKDYEEIGMIGVANCMRKLLDERNNTDEH